MFVVIHSRQNGLRINADKGCCILGQMMDARLVPIGCTSNRQDIVHREFNAFDEFVTDCLLRGYGHSVPHQQLCPRVLVGEKSRPKETSRR